MRWSRDVAICLLLCLGVVAILRTETPLVASAQSGPTADGGPREIDPPAYKVGDEWRYSGGVYSRVVGLEGNLVVIATNADPRCPNCRFFRNPAGTLVKVHDAQNKQIDHDLVGLKLLDFPLEIGKEWKHDMMLWIVQASSRQPYSNQFRIEAYEPVTTKAGTFKAYRISWQQDGTGSNRWSGKLNIWWSPDIRGYVKRQVYTSNWLSSYELESYSLK